jgi:hypothetical protein
MQPREATLSTPTEHNEAGFGTCLVDYSPDFPLFSLPLSTAAENYQRRKTYLLWIFYEIILIAHVFF